MIKKRALLLSGGLDSVAALILESPDIAVHLETPINKFETRAVSGLIKALPENLMPPHGILIEKIELPLARWRYGSDEYIPLRNLMFTTIAINSVLETFRNSYESEWPDLLELWIVGVLGGHQDDKNPEVFAEWSELITSMFAETKIWGGWDKVFPDVNVTSPFWESTKSDLVRRMHKKLGWPTALSILHNNIYTCFSQSATGQRCGKCSACWRFFVALDRGFEDMMLFDTWFDTPPFKSQAAHDYYVRAIDGKYPVRKAQDHINVWRRYNELH